MMLKCIVFKKVISIFKSIYDALSILCCLKLSYESKQRRQATPWLLFHAQRAACLRPWLEDRGNAQDKGIKLRLRCDDRESDHDSRLTNFLNPDSGLELTSESEFGSSSEEEALVIPASMASWVASLWATLAAVMECFR